MKPLFIHTTTLLLAACLAPAKEITVEQAPFEATVALEGTLLPSKSHPMSFDVEEWTTLSILDVKEQGAPIAEGEAVVTLDLEDLDRKISDNKDAAALREMALANAERELANLEVSTAWKLAVAERTYQRTKEDLAYFKEMGRALEEESAARTVDRAKRFLENQEEELAQLLKMYEEDEITEETEEIILKRQRNAVKDARYTLRRAELSAKRTLEVALPRQAVDLEQGFKDAELTWSTLQDTVPRALEQKRLEVKGSRLAHERASAKEAALIEERKLLGASAPVAGTVYHGEFTGGKWNPANAAKYMRPGGAVPAKAIYATVVPAGGTLQLHAFVSEAAIHEVRKDQEGYLKPAALDRKRLPVRVKSASAYPGTDGTYHVVLDVDQSAVGLGLVPGMKGKATLFTTKKEKALLIPSDALTEEADGSFSVQIKLADGAAERRVVVPGVAANGKVEILEGLEAGQVVIMKGGTP